MDRDHDQNFKNLILDYPRQALAFFAASEAAAVDKPVTITPIRQEQLKARPGDRFRELDVPLLVECPDGRREALLSDNLRLYAQALRGLLDLDTNPGRQAKYLDSIDSYAVLADNKDTQAGLYT